MRPKTEIKSPEAVGCKHYRPGDPEFEAIASRVTPLDKIRSEFSDIRTLPFIEHARDYHGRRKESINDLYAGGSLG